MDCTAPKQYDLELKISFDAQQPTVVVVSVLSTLIPEIKKIKKTHLSASALVVSKDEMRENYVEPGCIESL